MENSTKKNTKSTNRRKKTNKGRKGNGNGFNNNQPYSNNNKHVIDLGNNGKKVEMNIPNSSLNKADLRVLTAASHKNNDISWYNRIDSLYQPATKVPFNIVPGLPYEVMRKDNPAPAWTQAFTTPSVMTIRLAPTVGRSDDVNSAVNIAAQQLYVETTRKNNRDGQYDRTDLMMMILAMDSAYMLLGFLDRAYRAFQNISASNRYYPLRLLESMKINTNDMQVSLAQFRSRINLFAYKLGAINVPDQLAYITRHSWLFTHIYKDADTEKAQAYMYMPDGFYVWTEGKGETPNYLAYTSFEDVFGLTTTKPYINLANVDRAINTILDPLLGSSYIGLMSADLAMAFDSMIKVSPVEEMAELTPVYDEEVLYQISNLTQIKDLDRSTLNITQKLNDLVVGPFLSCHPSAANSAINQYLTLEKKYVNFRSTNEPSQELIMEGTRLISEVELDTTNSVLEITTCGAEIVTDITIYGMSYTHSYNSQFTSPVYASTDITAGLVFGPTNSKAPILQILLMSKFDWAPTQYIYYASDESGNNNFYGVIQDLDNYTYLSADQIKMLNDAAVMSLFKVSSYPV